MNSRPCLKCGHVAESPGELPDACPMCGAIYARVEAALARGEVIHRPRPEEMAARSEDESIAPRPRPGLVMSVLIGLGFSITLFALLAGIAVFGMIMSAPGDAHGIAWSRGFKTFVGGLVAGWSFAAAACMILSLLRRPVAGLFAGLACGVAAGLVYGLVLR